MLQSYYSRKVEIMLDKLLFGENYPIYKVEENSNKIILYIKSKLNANVIIVIK